MTAREALEMATGALLCDERVIGLFECPIIQGPDWLDEFYMLDEIGHAEVASALLDNHSVSAVTAAERELER